MPIYQYESAKHGIRHAMQFPVASRPGVIVLRRRTVPSRITVGTGAQPPTMSDKLALGYKTLEARGQLAPRGPGALSTKTIKRALAMPETD